MNKYQLADAYAALVKNYSLRADQRDNLDRSDDYLAILQFVHEGMWLKADELIQSNNYFKSGDADDPKFELVG